MKCCYLDKPIFKDVVIIGNGPSGIVLSLMLDGWTPYLTNTRHPDEFLASRLEGALTCAAATRDGETTECRGLPLVHADLLALAQGLDGRTTNPVSLLYDALMRPFADMGLEMEALITWRRTKHQEIVMHSCRKLVEDVVFFKNLPTKLLVQIVTCLKVEVFLENDVIAKANTIGDAMFFIATGTVAIYTLNGLEIDHIVLGKGPPGGSWHAMDPHILTLSLASWMALPDLPFPTTDGADISTAVPLRASAQQVARYYDNYVRHMDLDGYFRNNVIVTEIKPVGDKCAVIRELRSQCEYQWVQKIKNDRKNHQTVCTSTETKVNPLCNNNPQQCRRRCLAGYIRTWMPRRCSNTQYQIQQEPLKDRPSIVTQSTAHSDTKALIHEIFDPMIVEDRGRSLDDYSDDVCIDCQKERAQARGNGTDALRYDFCRCQCNRENNYRGSTKKRKEERNDGAAGKGGGGHNNTTTKTINPTIFHTNNNKNKSHPKWLVDIYDKTTRVMTTYTCNTLVLANGAHDLPNKLSLHQPNQQDDQQHTLAEPHWLLHDVRSLEIELDLCMETRQQRASQLGKWMPMRDDGGVENVQGIDPVLVVGAGLSAADAILATRKRGIPVLHIFRSKSSDLIKKLPENMYPEYHKIHQMMLGQATPSNPSYTSFPAHTINAIDAASSTVTIVDEQSGVRTTHRVSFAAVLIGSRPDLSFLPPGYKLGKRKTVPVDSKTNTVNIDRATHAVSGFENLYALGPLAGDNFVRFLPGGCLAAVGDMYRKNGVTILE